MSSSFVCTIFEGKHHYGVTSLLNSLIKSGFDGVFVIGYRGNGIPIKHSSSVVLNHHLIEAEVHLTNYKPQFLQTVIEKHAISEQNVFYFDPDITIKAPWHYFEEWVSNGISFCEDVNSPLTSNHPLINQWKKYLEPKGLSFQRELDTYVNGGFVGLRREDFGFLKIWQDVQDAIAPMLDGMKQMNLGGERSSRTFPFAKHDQDALNMAIRCSTFPVSIIGQEGMDFKPGGYIMSHAIGVPKPWEKCYTLLALRGKKPSLADIGYWKHASGKIKIYSRSKLFLHKLDLFIGRALGRYLG